MATETKEASEGTSVPCRLRHRGGVILNKIGLRMKTKYESELWFPEKSLPECISAKDALKVTLTETLETMLDCKIKHRHFLIRLTYACPISSKTGTHNGLDTSDDDIKCYRFLTSEAGVLVERLFGSLQANESSMYLKLHLEQGVAVFEYQALPFSELN